MKKSKSRVIISYLRKMVQSDEAGQTDGQLLRRYVDQRDETAFAVLVRRHGSMVLAVCRRMLRHAEDAEDAFQATFVVLARAGFTLRQGGGGGGEGRDGGGGSGVESFRFEG